GGTPRDVALTEVGIGSTLHLLNRYDEAKSHLRQALESFAPGTLEAALCQHYLGKTFAATHEHAEAIRNLEAALAVYQRAGNPKEEAQVLALLGQVRQQQGRLGGARRFYARSLRRFERLSDRINQSAVLYALGRLEMRAGNLDAAEDFLKRSLDVTEGIRRAPASSDLTAAFSASVYERYETYVECLMRRHEARPDQALAARAFETSELARARSLTEWVRERQGSLLQGLDPKLAERERSLRLSLRVREDTRLALLNRRHRPDELAELEAELARLETEYVRVEEEIRARHPSFGRLITRAPAWDLRRIQERVVADDDTVLLEFGLGEEKGYVWAVTRDRIRSYELPPRELINEAARKVYALLSAPPRFGGEDELAAATRELSRLVLSPVASELNKRRLVVVADGALNYIPFQVLPSPAGGDEPLVASFQVVNAPSATTLGELRQEAEGRRPAAKVLAAFGDPVFASNYAQHLGSQGSGAALAAVQPSRGDGARSAVRDIELDGDTFDPASIQPLFYARRELTHLLAAAGTGSFVASDFAATREQLLGADLTQFAILHFATHGLLDPRRPEHSGLVFSTVGRDGRPLEGFVALQNIYGLRAPVSLVVLSACRTALGKDVRGEGLLGLTRAFMHAGASGVVASLWKVDDEATAELMKQFYTGMLREGQTPAEALRAAQNAVRQRPEWRSPYYWAAFTLQGESRPVAVTSVPAAGAMNLYLSASAGAALLMLSAGAGLWYLRRGRRARRA
ncbi:MAG TPA: CHAT domain-containing tetratricopeptide repeat protein, partial [Pyrinomonadaceae bacterium]|nr:CHAT domain-containing tetratricopeptide repeat protein [Pyrinomonadaceae bacterium]